MKEHFLCGAQGLAIGYGKTPLLSDICLGVQPGQILTLIGPNGAGKSTLLRTLAGQLAPMGGTVLLEGRNLADYTGTQRAQKLALMAPHSRRMELTTCFDFVSAGRYPYTGRLGILSAEDRQQVHRALELVGAAHLADRDFNRISDGQRQRILLARAVCQQPELLLLDEPTSFLDIKGKIELLTILKRLAQQRNTAVIVSLHELDLAQKAADRVVCVSPDGVTPPAPPEAVFTPERIKVLYGVTQGEYNTLFGSVELPRPEGEPKTFVIGGGGAGIPIYRRLQRQNCPFYAGILYENDLDYPVAQALAAGVVSQRPFTPAEPEQIERAKKLITQCEQVLCAPQSDGAWNAANRALRAFAAEQGKLVDEHGL